MKALMIYMAVTCQGPVRTQNIDLINNKMDQIVYQRAIKVCKFKYKACLRSLVKTDKGSYQVKCGK